MAENSLKLMTAKIIDTETSRCASRINKKVSTPVYIIFRLQETKGKEKILKISEETKLPNTWRSKYKKVITILFRNHVYKEIVK